MNRNKTTDTNQASEDELRETIERLLRFNCPNGCDGNGSYPEMSSDGEWEQGQCQWCFEYGMPARDAIQSLIRTEKPTVEHKPNPSSDLRGMIVYFTSEMLDNPNDYGIYPTTNFYNDLEEAILDWHNKQI